jgi:aldose 1-epimerase
VTVRREPWGTTRDGEPVELFTLEAGGIRARLTNFGATLVSLEVPDRRGERADVVLGFDSLSEYESTQNPYFGGIVGRCANRIAGARFTLDGREHVLAANEGRNHLHGGVRGFDRRTWTPELEQGGGARFRRESPAGEEGYPGRLEVSASFGLRPNSVGIRILARADAPTPCNLTQHAYFNLAGNGTVLEHELQVCASSYLVVDDELLPTGEIASVAGTPFDFRTPRPIGERIHELTSTLGYDVCYALDGPVRQGSRRAARLHDPRSGRMLEIVTSAPGLQLYSGNHLDGLAGKRGARYPRHAGVCLEAQHFPDAVHHAGFPSVVLRPGQGYESHTVWAFPG